MTEGRFDWETTEKGMEITLKFGPDERLGTFSGIALDLPAHFLRAQGNEDVAKYLLLIGRALLGDIPVMEAFRVLYGEDAEPKILFRPRE